MASFDDVGRQPGGRGSRRVLYPECRLHGNCSEEEKQEAWRLFDHHQASERFLALGLSLFNLHIILICPSLVIIKKKV